MKQSKPQLNSWQAAQRRIKEILEGLNENPPLLMAAAANPLLALAELGYEVPEELHQEFEDRIRFGADVSEKLQALRSQVHKHAGAPFPINSPDALGRVLAGLLDDRQARQLTPEHLAPLEATPRAPKPVDPLEKFRAAHPVMKPLLEYRRLEGSRPRFATRETYEAVRRADRLPPLTKLVARLKRTT